jgi:hypothetical protein
MFLVSRRLEELGASVGMANDMSMTFEDVPNTTRVPEMATIVGKPIESAAQTVLLPGSANQSSPGQPSTFGPVTGQVGPMVRYRRPLLGVLGAAGVIAALTVVVMLLRGPSAGSHTKTDNPVVAAVTPPPPGQNPTDPAPAQNAAPDAKPTGPADSAEKPADAKPAVRRPPIKRVVKKNKKFKRRFLKRTPARKPSGNASGKPSGTAGVSVVD